MADVINARFGEQHGDVTDQLNDVFGTPSDELRRAIHNSLDIALTAAYVEGYVAGAELTDGLDEE